ncbi:hypothetical protein MKJ04_07245 [Pontibacter sp. E15-1]|uniref:hypothetical protein n=1 Tax=Pontibacter sp. E15-1 TaxID=2919918 RepID=UPI001F4F5F74|nr:hypothetical protein [Pontibacter sp. E15-1]MCJ8164636.1 hypothetical protein [Pontibacter sp. E15-1]
MMKSTRSWMRTLCLYTIITAGLLLGACSGPGSISNDSDMELLDIDEGIEEVPALAYDGKLLAQVVFDSVDYIVARQELFQPFIREFGDGTVVSQVVIRKVQETQEDEPAYYLVGIGMLNGQFRSMALTLDRTSDNSLYLSSKGQKQICKASAGCNFCYFAFSGNKITGCECDTRNAGNTCTHVVAPNNNLLRDVKLKNHRE